MESNRRLTRAVALILGSVIYSFFLLDIFPVTLKFVSVKKKMIFFMPKILLSCLLQVSQVGWNDNMHGLGVITGASFTL